MKKIAFIFPGQGSQYIGMGKDFYETFPCAKEMIDLAEKVSGIPMKELLFEENENINITIKKIQDKNDKKENYAAYWEKDSVFYQISGKMQQSEFIKLVKNIKF